MRNIKLVIEYDGTNFYGWQVQNRKQRTENRRQRIKSREQNKCRTVQGIIEEALRKILQEKVKIIGSGRTDSGTHAKAQVANFKTDSKLNCENLIRALNASLPSDIRIKEVKDVKLSFNARFKAKSKKYRYYIFNAPYQSPFFRFFSLHVSYLLDIEKMRKACRYLIGTHNFKSFQKKDKIERNSVRTIKKIKITKKGKLIFIDIESEGFLYNMARNITGTLLEVGRNKIKPCDIRSIIRAKDRKRIGATVPAKGLHLMEVKYR